VIYLVAAAGDGDHQRCRALYTTLRTCVAGYAARRLWVVAKSATSGIKTSAWHGISSMAAAAAAAGVCKQHKRHQQRGCMSV